jgi:hypothetical protein
MLSLTAGCGSVTNAVSLLTKPIDGATKTIASATKNVTGAAKGAFAQREGEYQHMAPSDSSRMSTDSFDAVPEGVGYNTAPREEPRAEKQEASDRKPNKNKELNKALANDTADHDFVRNPLEATVTQLEQQEKEEYRKMREFQDKVRELNEMRDQYELKHLETQKKIAKMSKVLEMIDDNPAALEQKRKRPAAEENGLAAGDVQACSGGDWRPSGKKEAENFRPKISSDYDNNAGYADSTCTQRRVTVDVPALRLAQTDGKPAVAGPPVDSDNSGWSAPRSLPAARNEAPARAVGGNEITAKILTCEGTGRDSIGIIAAGSRGGVKQGMLFGGKGGAVLVVTDVYPTYARVVPHPKYSGNGFQTNEEVVQINSLP